jgi:hypothetical protein
VVAAVVVVPVDVVVVPVEVVLPVDVELVLLLVLVLVLHGLGALGLPGGPVCLWFLSPQPQPGRDGSVLVDDPVDVPVDVCDVVVWA